MKKLLAENAKNNPALTSLIKRRFYRASALGHNNIPAKPKFPFVVYREIDVTPITVAKDTEPDLCRRTFQIYVHDEKGGYSRIDTILRVLKETVVGLTHQTSSTGAYCREATWNGTSADSEDPTYDSNMKFATFTLISSN